VDAVDFGWLDSVVGGRSRVDPSRFQCQNIKEIKEENEVE